MNDYTEIQRLAAHKLALERTLEALEERVAGFKRQLRQVSEFDLPEAVDSLEWDGETMEMDGEGDMVMIWLPGGGSVCVRDSFHPHITAEKRLEAMNWIRLHGGAPLLRSEVSVSFPLRGSEDDVTEVLKALQATPAATRGTVDVNDKIHSSTLAKFCRDKIAAGEELPETLGVFNRRVASVTPPPERRPTNQPPLKKDDGVYAQ